MSQPLHELGIAEAGDLIQRRLLSPVELTEALLARIDTYDSQIDAFITLTREVAMSQARAAEAQITRGGWLGPLHGIPYGLKDVYNTAGIATTGHSRIGADHVPTQDSAVASKLKAAGAVLMGKLATFQFTHGGPSFDPPWPPARNPWNTVHDAGGSSSGPAAAVAAGFLPGAMGTDTGGSVRIPASFCGLAGLKPTSGLVSRRGVIPNSSSFDHCGPIARNADDCAILLQAVAGFDPLDPSSVQRRVPDFRAAFGKSIKGLRIGVLRHFWEEDVAMHPAVPIAIDNALDVFRDLGASIETARVRPLQDYYDIKNIITKSEVFSMHQQDLSRRAEDFGADFLGMTLGGCLFQAVDYVQAQRERTSMMNEINALYQRYDILLAPNAGPAPAMSRKASIELWQARSAPSSLCIPFSIAGGPSLALCMGFTDAGLPLGMQIAGRPFEDALVLQMGHAYEQATAWHKTRATLMADAGRPPVPHRSGASSVPIPFDAGSDLTASIAERAGLHLGDAELASLRKVHPYADAMGERLRRARPWAVESSNVFDLARYKEN